MVRHLRPAVLVAVVIAALSAAGAQGASRLFAVRSIDNIKGNFVFVSNTLMTCPAAASGCTDARNGVGSGGALNDNNYAMEYVDADSDGSTFDSSSATLSLPAGSTVTFAGLYWGADTSAGSGGSAAPAAGQNNQVLLTPPGGSAATVTAGQMDSIGTRYQGFADVTSAVASAGNGAYTVANVQAGTGNDRYGAWAIVVVYENAAEVTRNITVFDGFQVVQSPASPTIVIPVTGFLTPPVGAVNTSLGVIGYEGDLGSTGDSLTLDSTVVTNAVNPSANFFNSTISQLGTLVTSKSPDYPNQLGFDADVADVSGVLANSAMSAAITLTTGGETYFPGVVVFATELYAPDLLTDITKSVADVDGGSVEPGDVLEYSVSFSNVGTDGAVDTVLTDAIPSGTTYLPGSLEIVSGANAGALTDAAGDDQAEYDSGAGQVVFRLGVGGTSSAGGSFAPGASSTARFRATVDPSAADGDVVSNTAGLAYSSQTLGTDYTGSSPAADVTVSRQADLSVTKSSVPDPFSAGSSLTYTAVVTNNGPADVVSASVTDTLPAPLAGFAWTCSPGCTPAAGTGNVSTQVDLTSGASATVTISGTVPGGTTGPIANTVSVAPPAGTVDPTPGNNTATNTNPGGGTSGGGTQQPPSPSPPPQADVSIVKSGPASANVGDTVTFVLVARNAGPAEATGVVIKDTLPAGMELVSSAISGAAGGSCSQTPQTVECTVPVLANGASVTVTITARITGGAGGSLRNVGSILSPIVDPAYGNNTSAASVAIGMTPPPPPPVEQPTKPGKPAAPVKPALRLRKAWLSSTVVAGHKARVRIVVSNAGRGPARNVLVCDRPSDRFAFVAVPRAFFLDGAACRRIARLAPGASVGMVFTVRIDNDVRGVVSNLATATAANFRAVVRARARVRVKAAAGGRPGGVTG